MKYLGGNEKRENPRILKKQNMKNVNQNKK